MVPLRLPRKLLFVLQLLLPLALVPACSHVVVEPVAPGDTDRSGVRFYRPWPYLLVTEDRNGARLVQVIQLPDRSQEYVIEPRVRLGSVEVEATLEEGWRLDEIGAGADPEVAETLDAVARLVTAGGAVAAAPAGAPAFPLEPGLYRLLFDGGHVSGVARVDLAPR